MKYYKINRRIKITILSIIVLSQFMIQFPIEQNKPIINSSAELNDTNINTNENQTIETISPGLPGRFKSAVYDLEISMKNLNIDINDNGELDYTIISGKEGIKIYNTKGILDWAYLTSGEVLNMYFINDGEYGALLVLCIEDYFSPNIICIDLNTKEVKYSLNFINKIHAFNYKIPFVYHVPFVTKYIDTNQFNSDDVPSEYNNSHILLLFFLDEIVSLNVLNGKILNRNNFEKYLFFESYTGMPKFSESFSSNSILFKDLESIYVLNYYTLQFREIFAIEDQFNLNAFDFLSLQRDLAYISYTVDEIEENIQIYVDILSNESKSIQTYCKNSIFCIKNFIPIYESNEIIFYEYCNTDENSVIFNFTKINFNNFPEILIQEIKSVEILDLYLHIDQKDVYSKNYFFRDLSTERTPLIYYSKENSQLKLFFGGFSSIISNEIQNSKDIVYFLISIKDSIIESKKFKIQSYEGDLFNEKYQKFAFEGFLSCGLNANNKVEKTSFIFDLNLVQISIIADYFLYVINLTTILNAIEYSSEIIYPEWVKAASFLNEKHFGEGSFKNYFDLGNNVLLYYEIIPELEYASPNIISVNKSTGGELWSLSFPFNYFGGLKSIEVIPDYDGDNFSDFIGILDQLDYSKIPINKQDEFGNLTKINIYSGKTGEIIKSINWNQVIGQNNISKHIGDIFLLPKDDLDSEGFSILVRPKSEVDSKTSFQNKTDDYLFRLNLISEDLHVKFLPHISVNNSTYCPLPSNFIMKEILISKDINYLFIGSKLNSSINSSEVFTFFLNDFFWDKNFTIGTNWDSEGEYNHLNISWKSYSNNSYSFPIISDHEYLSRKKNNFPIFQVVYLKDLINETNEFITNNSYLLYTNLEKSGNLEFSLINISSGDLFLFQEISLEHLLGDKIFSQIQSDDGKDFNLNNLVSFFKFDYNNNGFRDILIFGKSEFIVIDGYTGEKYHLNTYIFDNTEIEDVMSMCVSNFDKTNLYILKYEKDSLKKYVFNFSENNTVLVNDKLLKNSNFLRSKGSLSVHSIDSIFVLNSYENKVFDLNNKNPIEFKKYPKNEILLALKSKNLIQIYNLESNQIVRSIKQDISFLDGKIEKFIISQSIENQLVIESVNRLSYCSFSKDTEFENFLLNSFVITNKFYKTEIRIDRINFSQLSKIYPFFACNLTLIQLLINNYSQGIFFDMNFPLSLNVAPGKNLITLIVYVNNIGIHLNIILTKNFISIESFFGFLILGIICIGVIYFKYNFKRKRLEIERYFAQKEVSPT